jgi:hypothetical protein
MLDLGVERPRDVMMPRDPETEALDGGSASIEPRDPRVDGSPVPLGSTATGEPIEIPRSLWGRWRSPDAAGSKPCGSRSKAIQNKLISVIINDHRGTSGMERQLSNHPRHYPRLSKLYPYTHHNNGYFPRKLKNIKYTPH